MTVQSLLLKTRFGEHIEMLLQIPAGTGPYKAVLFVSGFGVDLHGDRNAFDELAGYLVSQGMLTVQFSFSGCGKSEGDYREMTLERQARQIEDVLIWMKERTDIAGDSIGILATSFGVPCVLLTNLFDAKAFVFVSGMYSPAISLPRVLHEHQYTIGKNLLLSISAFALSAAAMNVSQPTLTLSGDKDTVVVQSDLQQFMAALGTTDKKEVHYPDGDHGLLNLRQSAKGKLIQEIGEWFALQL